MERWATDWDKIFANIPAIEYMQTYMQTEYAKNSYNRQIKQ